MENKTTMDLTDLKKHWIDGDKIEFHTEDYLYVNEKLYWVNDSNLHDQFIDWVVIQSYNVLKDACLHAAQHIKHKTADEDTYNYLMTAIKKSSNF